MTAVVRLPDSVDLISAYAKNIEYREWAEKEAKDKSDSIYSSAPEMVDPKIPLTDSLESAALVGSVFNATILKIADKSFSGSSGTVEFRRIKDDKDLNRLYAIKHPKLSSPIKDLPDYENNMRVAARLGPHENFMGVKGIVIKQIGSKDATDFMPYLFLEHIDGLTLKDACKGLTLEDKLDLISQMKSAILHLHDQGICPIDTHPENILISSCNKLKFIDYDQWNVGVDMDSIVRERIYIAGGPVVREQVNGREHLYDVALTISLCLLNKMGVALPLVKTKLASRKQLENALDTLIQAFSSANSTCCVIL